MNKQIEENGKELYNDLASIMSEEYEKRMLITPSYCANKMLEKGYRKESDTAREILTELMNTYIRREDNNDTSYAEDKSITMNDLFDLAEKYGVEVE